MSYLFFTHLRELARPRRLIPLVFIVLILSLASIFLTARLDGVTPTQAFGAMISLFTFRMVALGAAIFATTVLAQEIEQKTIVYLLTRPIERWQLYLMRALAAALMVFLLCVTSLTIVSVAVLKSAAFGVGYWNDVLAIGLGCLAYTSLFTFISLIANKSMTLNLLYAFGVETIAGLAPGNLVYGTVFGHMQGIARHTPIANRDILSGLAGTSKEALIPAGVAIPSLMIASGILLSVGCVWFTLFEYLPREDAE